MPESIIPPSPLVVKCYKWYSYAVCSTFYFEIALHTRAYLSFLYFLCSGMHTDANGMHEVYEILVVVSSTELAENFREIFISANVP